MVLWPPSYVPPGAEQHPDRVVQVEQRALKRLKNAIEAHIPAPVRPHRCLHSGCIFGLVRASSGRRTIG